MRHPEGESGQVGQGGGRGEGLPSLFNWRSLWQGGWGGFDLTGWSGDWTAGVQTAQEGKKKKKKRTAVGSKVYWPLQSFPSPRSLSGLLARSLFCLTACPRATPHTSHRRVHTGSQPPQKNNATISPRSCSFAGRRLITSPGRNPPRKRWKT